MQREDYDVLASLVEAGLRQQYPQWAWEVLRYRRLPFADTVCGPPKWLRVRAEIRVVEGRFEFQTKQWLLNVRPVADLVTDIGARVQHEWARALRERIRRVALLEGYPSRKIRG